MLFTGVSVGLNCFRIHAQLNTSIFSETFPSSSSSISEFWGMPAYMTSWTHSIFPVRHPKFNQASCVYIYFFPPRESTTMLVTVLLLKNPCLLIINMTYSSMYCWQNKCSTYRKVLYMFNWAKILMTCPEENLNGLRKCSREWQFCISMHALRIKGKV